MSASEAVPLKVYVRSRPLNTRELEEKSSVCVQFYVNENQLCCSNSKSFTFDAVLDPSTSQESVFDVTCSTLFEKFFKGFNCTLIAYGQTGSGKTFTMGTEETSESIHSDNRGIIPRLVHRIFCQIEEDSQEEKIKYQVRVSMLEIYDEKVNDLFSQSRDLAIREINGCVQVPGLQMVEVRNLTETVRQLERGCQLRSKGETAMNAKSSRSHAIFTIELTRCAVDEDLSSGNFSTKLHLVDLAGSERLKKTMAEGERMREGIRINEGLLALGNVISALSEPNSHKHIPYRDSKITRLLQDSLGGNAYTVMIACISPADSNADETLSTLRYADRAKRIKNKPVVNVDPDKQLIKQLMERVAEYEKQLAEFRAGIFPTTSTSSGTASNNEELESLKEQIATMAQHQKQQKHKLLDSLCKINLVEREREKLEENIGQLKTIIGSVAEVDAEDPLGAVIVQAQQILGEADAGDCGDKTCEFASEVGGDSSAMETDEEDTVAKFVTSQEKYNEEMESIQQKIKQYQLDIVRETADGSSLQELMKNREAEVSALKAKLASLSEEKDKLEAELRKFTSSGKIAEERRQKLKALEKEILQYKKQYSEMKRLEKQKALCEENMKRMQNEVLELKKVKVQIMKKAKADADEYRKWKTKTARDMAQMANREKRREVEMAKDKQLQQRQLAVLKQKLEEARRWHKRPTSKIINKIEALTTKEKKSSESEIKRMFDDLLDEVARVYNGEQIINGLLGDRARIARSLNEAQRSMQQLLDEPSTKKRRTDDSSINMEELVETKKREIEQLDAELKILTNEIGEIQKSLTAGDVDTNAASLCMKLAADEQGQKALKVLFDVASNFRRNIVDACIQSKADQKKLKECEKDLRAAKSDKNEEIRSQFTSISQDVADVTSSLGAKLSSILSSIVVAGTVPEGVSDIIVQQISRLEEIVNRVESASDKLQSSGSHRHNKEVSISNIVLGPRHRNKVVHYGDAKDSSEVCRTPLLENRTRRSKTKKHLPPSPIPIELPEEKENESRESSSGPPASDKVEQYAVANSTFVVQAPSDTYDEVRPLAVTRGPANLGNF